MATTRHLPLAATHLLVMFSPAWQQCTLLHVSIHSPLLHSPIFHNSKIPTVYENIGNKYKLEWPTTILGVLAILVTLPIYVFYWKGPEIREKSKFAQTLASDRLAKDMGKQNKKEIALKQRKGQKNDVNEAEKGMSTGQDTNGAKSGTSPSNNTSSLNSTEATGPEA